MRYDGNDESGMGEGIGTIGDDGYDGLLMSAAPPDDDDDDFDDDDDGEGDVDDQDDDDTDDESDGDDDDTDSDDSDDDEDEDDDDDDDDDEGDDDGIDSDSLESIANEGKTTVPISRLNKVIQERDMLMGMLRNGKAGGSTDAAQQQEQEQQVPSFDVAAKRKERNEAIIDGDLDKAEAIEREIDDYREQVANSKAAAAAQSAIAQDKIARAITRTVKKFPILDTNPDVLDETMALRDVLIRKGVPVAEAIATAAERVCGRYARPDDKPAGKRKAGMTAEQRARADQIRRRADRASRQPPRTSGGGTSGRSANPLDVDVEKMTDDQYEAWRKKNPQAHRALRSAI